MRAELKERSTTTSVGREMIRVYVTSHVLTVAKVDIVVEGSRGAARVRAVETLLDRRVIALSEDSGVIEWMCTPRKCKCSIVDMVCG
jgi:hypothetical protein